MYGNLQRKGLGGFRAENYWSSTPGGLGDGGGLKISFENFSDGIQGGVVEYMYEANISQKYRVRAICQF